MSNTKKELQTELAALSEKYDTKCNTLYHSERKIKEIEEDRNNHLRRLEIQDMQIVKGDALLEAAREKTESQSKRLHDMQRELNNTNAKLHVVVCAVQSVVPPPLVELSSYQADDFKDHRRQY